MKTLPLKLRKSGHDYTQVLRGEKCCIYEQCFQGKKISWEVFKIKITRERELNGTVIEASERFPNNEAFGNWAWAITSWERALEKHHELMNP